jgi:predicted DNA-binding transcriptional regulator YafY
MAAPTERRLELLTVLQAGGTWPADVLARRMGVSERTVRRDAQRLRELGYDIRSRPGPGAAYELRPGMKIPPLLLTEEEVTAMVTAIAVLGAWTPGDPVVAAAAAKLEQVLPPRLSRRARATALATQVMHRAATSVDVTMIGVLADAVAGSARVRFGYRDQRGRSSERLVEPYRHILRGGHWYLVAFDVDRDDWRVFRLDRLSGLELVPGPFRVREFPEASLEQWLVTDFGRSDAR